MIANVTCVMRLVPEHQSFNERHEGEYIRYF